MLCVDILPAGASFPVPETGGAVVVPESLLVVRPGGDCPYVLMSHAEAMGLDLASLGVTGESVAQVFAWGFGAVIFAWGLGWGVGVVKKAIGKF